MESTAQPFDIGTWADNCPKWGRGSETQVAPASHPPRQPPSPPADTTGTRSTSLPRVRRLSLWILAWTIALLLSVLFLLLIPFSEDVTKNHAADEADCLWFINSIKSVKHFPFPHPIDGETYGVILRELQRPSMLGQLIDARSDSCSTLNTTINRLLVLVAKGARIYTRFPSQGTVVTLREEINTTHEQLDEAISMLGAFAGLYDSLGVDYRALNASAVEAFEEAQLNRTQTFWLEQEPLIRQWWTSFNASQAYLVPLQEKSRKREQAHSALVAWKRETERLEQISEVLRGIDNLIQHFAESLPQRGTRWSGLRGLGQWVGAVKPRGMRDSDEKWLRTWFRRQMANNDQLREAGTQLVKGASDEEEVYVVDLNPDWCQRE